MKISLFSQYGALNSQPVFDAFEQGARKIGMEVVRNHTSAEIYAIWSVLWHGRMKNNEEIWNLAKKQGKKLIVLEVGGLKRGTTWRVGLNHVNNLGNFCKNLDLDFDRPKKLGIFLKNREKRGEKILICGQHSLSEQWRYRPRPEIWLTELVTSIKKYSTREIVFRPHPRDAQWAKSLPNLGIKIRFPEKINGTYDDFDHDKDFDDAWCVINPSSNTGIQAAINGIPVLTDEDSLAYPVSFKDLSKIENCSLPDRNKWIVEVCHMEWLIDELKNGLPLAKILDI